MQQWYKPEVILLVAQLAGAQLHPCIPDLGGETDPDGPSVRLQHIPPVAEPVAVELVEPFNHIPLSKLRLLKVYVERGGALIIQSQRGKQPEKMVPFSKGVAQPQPERDDWPLEFKVFVEIKCRARCVGYPYLIISLFFTLNKISQCKIGRRKLFFSKHAYKFLTDLNKLALYFFILLYQ